MGNQWHKQRVKVKTLVSRVLSASKVLGLAVNSLTFSIGNIGAYST